MTEMGMAKVWTRLSGSAVLALTVAAGGAWAEETGGAEPPFEGDTVVSDEESPISGEGVEGEVTVVSVGGSGLPPGDEQLAESGMVVRQTEGDHRGSEFTQLAQAKAETGANLCTSPELYVAWLCEWQGYPQP